MYYSLENLGNYSRYDLMRVSFDGKEFMFWKKKNGPPVTEVLVVLDGQSAERVPVLDGKVILSLDKIMGNGKGNPRDLRDAILIFQRVTKNDKIRIKFLISNNEQKEIIERVCHSLGVSYEIENANLAIKGMEEEMIKQAQNMRAGDGQMIEKYDNGQLKQITVQDGKAYENNGMLNTEEEKVSLLREWMKDPVKRDKLSRMSVEARDEWLTRTVLASRKEYRMESANEQIADDKVGELAMNKVSQEDGLVNTELGVVQNNVSNANQYSAVEQHGDNVQLVNPDVQHSYISSSGISSNTSSGNEVSESHNINTNVEDEQSRSIEDQVFYISPENVVYDSQDNQIGMLGQDYGIDYNDNVLLKNGEKIGYIGDYKDMGQAQSNAHAKPVVRTLKKPELDKNAGMVSLPVIIFILSALLLIGSAILLFVVD